MYSIKGIAVTRSSGRDPETASVHRHRTGILHREAIVKGALVVVLSLMTPEMAADAARMLRPKILYPYHFGETDTSRIVQLLRDQKETEVRVRRMQ